MYSIRVNIMRVKRCEDSHTYIYIFEIIVHALSGLSLHFPSSSGARARLPGTKPQVGPAALDGACGARNTRRPCEERRHSVETAQTLSRSLQTSGFQTQKKKKQTSVFDNLKVVKTCTLNYLKTNKPSIRVVNTLQVVDRTLVAQQLIQWANG